MFYAFWPFILGAWKHKLLKLCFKVQVFEIDTVIVYVETTQSQICENSDVMSMCITCLVYRFVRRDIMFL